jgi:subfamily B ATP-binding cassette protein MsbA
MAAQALQTPLSQLVAAIGVAAVVTIALIQSRSGIATVGDFVSFVAAMLMMFGPLRHLADLNAQLQRGIVAAEVVFGLLDEDSESDTGNIAKVNLKGKIHFDCVSLSYPGKTKEALSNISLTIYPGETVAIVGPSGCGKTSLVNLIPRLYEPSQGTILLDDRPLRDLKLSALRSQIALVSQDIVLFNDTIFNNVAYGFPSATRASVEAAIQAANLESFVATLPRGLDTEIGDRGVRISGGQRQRLAIARATLKDAPILILDEATSALDSESERNVKSALEKLRKGRTTLVIAHRLETTRDADKIVVFEAGRIVQEGKHETLLLQDGIYKQLYCLNKANSEQ